MLKAIIEILLQPSVGLRQLAKEGLSKGIEPSPLLELSEICPKDLDNVHRALA